MYGVDRRGPIYLFVHGLAQFEGLNLHKVGNGDIEPENPDSRIPCQKKCRSCRKFLTSEWNKYDWTKGFQFMKAETMQSWTRRAVIEISWVAPRLKIEFQSVFITEAARSFWV